LYPLDLRLRAITAAESDTWKGRLGSKLPNRPYRPGKPGPSTTRK
jgi:hypothetical protein